MTPLQFCLEFLNRLGVNYTHGKDFDASFTTSVFVDTRVLKGDGHYVLAVVPAESQIEVNKVRTLAGTQTLRFATEGELSSLMPWGEVDRIPPFGQMIGANVFLDSQVAQQDYMMFHVCTAHDLIHMPTVEFHKLAPAVVGSFAAIDYQKEFRRRMAFARASGA